MPRGETQNPTPPTDVLDEAEFLPDVIRDTMAMVPAGSTGPHDLTSPFSRMLESSTRLPEGGAYSWQMVQKTAENAIQMLSGRSDRELVEGLKMTEDLLSRLTGEMGMAAEKAGRQPDILLFLVKFKEAIAVLIKAREGKKDLNKLTQVNQSLLDLRNGIDSSLNNRITSRLVEGDSEFRNLYERKIAVDGSVRRLAILVADLEDITKEGVYNVVFSVVSTGILHEGGNASRVKNYFSTYCAEAGGSWPQLMSDSSRQNQEYNVRRGLDETITYINLRDIGYKIQVLQQTRKDQLAMLEMRINTRIESEKERLLEG